jgi:hypothetical protein
MTSGLRPDGAWCSHCALDEPMPLAEAIAHRGDFHQGCLSCSAEMLLFKAILEDVGQLVAVPADVCDCDCSPGRHWCFLCPLHGALTRRMAEGHHP